MYLRMYNRTLLSAFLGRQFGGSLMEAKAHAITIGYSGIGGLQIVHQSSVRGRHYDFCRRAAIERVGG